MAKAQSKYMIAITNGLDGDELLFWNEVTREWVRDIRLATDYSKTNEMERDYLVDALKPHFRGRGYDVRLRKFMAITSWEETANVSIRKKGLLNVDKIARWITIFFLLYLPTIVITIIIGDYIIKWLLGY